MSENILDEARRLTSSDRQGQYGHPAEHFARTAAGLNARFGTGPEALFKRDMLPQEWALMVAIDKLVGRGSDTTNMKRDSLVDAAGYCRTYEMCKEREKETTPARKRIYIAGPMRGIKWYNFPAFDEAKNDLYQGPGDWLPVSPADLDREGGFDPKSLPEDYDWSLLPPGFDFSACRRRDIEALETCEAIYMLKGWENSKGARAEYGHAVWAGKRVLEQSKYPEGGA